MNHDRNYENILDWPIKRLLLVIGEVIGRGISISCATAIATVTNKVITVLWA